MHVLFVHQNFPAQFGHIAERLIDRHGVRCTFLAENLGEPPGRIEPILYKCRVAATRATHPMSRMFENFTWRSQAAFEALKNCADVRPDVIVGHSGFGSTLFLRDLNYCPIVNYCEWFYRRSGSHEDLLNFGRDRNEAVPGADQTRNASLLADLDACTLAYSPTNWQRSRLPNEYQYKLETIFDGIDTSFWRPQKWRERIPRRIAGKWLPRWKKVVTYVSRGFESMRGFDVFMQVAQRICEKRSDVVFLCIGSDRVCYGGDMANIQEKSFREHVLKSGNYDLSRFIFTGPIPPEELRRAFAYSDLHIYLTVPFILSWSLMDALACGCTVLVADTPPLREVIEHGKNGLMAAYFDIDHFVELALEVLDDPAAYRRKLGQAGMETIHEKYDLDVVLPKMIKLYERAIAFRGGDPALGAGLPTMPKHMTAGLPSSSNGQQRIRRPAVSERGSVGDRPQRDCGWLSASEVVVLRGAARGREAHIGTWRMAGADDEVSGGSMSKSDDPSPCLTSVDVSPCGARTENWISHYIVVSSPRGG